jgi:hypothetical protein
MQLLFFNPHDLESISFGVTWEQIGWLPNFTVTVRDLWQHKVCPAGFDALSIPRKVIDTIFKSNERRLSETLWEVSTAQPFRRTVCRWCVRGPSYRRPRSGWPSIECCNFSNIEMRFEMN